MGCGAGSGCFRGAGRSVSGGGDRRRRGRCRRRQQRAGPGRPGGASHVLRRGSVYRAWASSSRSRRSWQTTALPCCASAASCSPGLMPTMPGRRRSWRRCAPTRACRRTRTSRHGWSRSRTARLSTCCAPAGGTPSRSRTPLRGRPRSASPARTTQACGRRSRELPDKQRQAVAYHYVAGLPYAEIAEILGGTVDAARRAAADGIRNLRKNYPGGRSTIMNEHS